MVEICPCGAALRFCPCCGRRLNVAPMVLVQPTNVATDSARLALAARAAPLSRTVGQWRGLLPAQPASAFDVFLAVAGHSAAGGSAANGSGGACEDAVWRLFSEWHTAQPAAVSAADTCTETEQRSRMARAWLAAPGALRSGCEEVASWWTAKMEARDAHPRAAPHPEPARTHCSTESARKESVECDQSQPVRSPDSLRPAALKRDRRAPPKDRRRYPSSFHLFRDTVKRKSVTQKVARQLWSSMSDAEKAPYDLQAAHLRTSGWLETSQTE